MEKRMPRALIAKLVVSLGILPVVLLLAVSGASLVAKLNSPCVLWGVQRDVPISSSGLPECRGIVEGISETQGAVLLRLAIWETVLASICGSAIIGVFRAKPFWGYLSAGLFLMMAFPLILGSLGIVMLFSAACCLTATILAISAIRAAPPEDVVANGVRHGG
jgi:hypothetical protein